MNYKDFVDGKKHPATAKPKGYNEGGPVVGPATPPDAVPAQLTGGEFVIPAPIVHHLGEAFFKRLVEQTTQEMAGGAAAPGMFDDMATDDGGAMVPGGMPSQPARRA